MNLSIVIPTKNRHKELQRLLKSLKKQSYQDFETIIIDQSTKDITLNEKRVRYFHRPNIQSLSEAKNFSIRYCSHNFIGFFDDDIVLDEDFLLNIINSIKKLNPIAISGIDNLAKEESKLYYYFKCIFMLGDLRDRRLIIKNSNANDIIETNKLSGGYTFYNKKIFEKINFRKKGIFHLNEDVDFSYLIRKKFNEKLYIDKKATVTHFTKNIKTKDIKDFRIIIKKTRNNAFTSLLIYELHLNKYLYFLPMIWFLFGLFIHNTYLVIKFKKIEILVSFLLGINDYFNFDRNKL